jgi:hypothetical protein
LAHGSGATCYQAGAAEGQIDMAKSTGKEERKLRVVADNRKARFNYFIDETFEVGLALTGTEVKSLRQGKATIAESYADSRGGEIWLINSNIPEYLQANRFNPAPKRPRKLLLRRRQINKLVGAVERIISRPTPRLTWLVLTKDRALQLERYYVQLNSG